jgi:hypothetical protein
MAETDFKFAGTVTSSAWTNADYVKADDTNYASVAVLKNSSSANIICHTFGFTSDDIPAGAVINGIEVVVSKFAGTDNALADQAFYLQYDGTNTGNNLASATKWGITSPSDVTYGGATNVWGTSLNQSQLTNNDFGLTFNVVNSTSSSVTAYLDFFKVKIYFTESTASFINVLTRKPFQHILVR